MNDPFKGCIFLLVGILTLSYVFNKRRKHKDISDWRGFIGGFGSIIFGLYLIILSL
jgi:uncharacterized membrane protein HdeD (DUF308 family)